VPVQVVLFYCFSSHFFFHIQRSKILYSSPKTSFSTCLDQIWHILFPYSPKKKEEEIHRSEENFHLWTLDRLKEGELYRIFDLWIWKKKWEEKHTSRKRKKTLNNCSRDLPQFSIYFVWYFQYPSIYFYNHYRSEENFHLWTLDRLKEKWKLINLSSNEMIFIHNTAKYTFK
jgi:hypothetical protein